MKNVVQTYSTLEKFMCFAYENQIHELVISDLHENLSILQRKGKYQNLLVEYQFNKNNGSIVLNKQIIDSTLHELGLLCSQQDILFIMMGNSQRGAIYDTCTEEEKILYLSLAHDYVITNMEKAEGIHGNKRLVRKIIPCYEDSCSC